jgi:hypothetical protein
MKYLLLFIFALITSSAFSYTSFHPSSYHPSYHPSAPTYHPSAPAYHAPSTPKFTLSKPAAPKFNLSKPTVRPSFVTRTPYAYHSPYSSYSLFHPGFYATTRYVPLFQPRWSYASYVPYQNYVMLSPGLTNTTLLAGTTNVVATTVPSDRTIGWIITCFLLVLFVVVIALI